MDNNADISDFVVRIFLQPTWIAPITKFIDEHCGIFEDVEENKFEYTAIHNAFRALVDSLLTAHLLESSISEEQFAQFCQQGLSEGNLVTTDVVQQLLAFDDFILFKAVMVKRNADLTKESLSALLSEEAAVAEQGVDSGLPPDTDDQMQAECLDLQRRCIEAELQLAMALSSQLQKRLELMEALAEVLETLTKMNEAEAALEAENAAAAQSATALATAGGSLAPDCLPQAVYVAPLEDQAVVDHVLEEERIDALRQRQRAERAVAFSKQVTQQRQLNQLEPSYPGYQSAWGSAPGSEPAAVPEPQQVQKPTVEQRQARAEHLKRQRDMLVQKKNRERQEELSIFQQTHGPSAAARAAESACARAPVGLQENGGPGSPSGAAGRDLARVLSGQAAAEAAAKETAAAQPDQEAKAAEMRRMLTRQLKQTLSGSLTGSGL